MGKSKIHKCGGYNNTSDICLLTQNSKEKIRNYELHVETDTSVVDQAHSKIFFLIKI